MSIFWKGFALQFVNVKIYPFWNRGIDRVYHGL